MSFTKEDTARAKGVGILLLMFHHLFYNPNFIENHGMEFWLIPKNVIQPIAVVARVCVWIFVFLSVYGLTIQYEAARGRKQRYNSMLNGGFLCSKLFGRRISLFLLGIGLYEETR